MPSPRKCADAPGFVCLGGSTKVGVKRGRIAHVDLPPTSAKRVARVTLSTEERVYAPRALLDEARDRHGDAELLFVDRGLLRRVGWLGTEGEAIDALVDGVISAKEAQEGGIPRPVVYGREVRHVRAGVALIVRPPSSRDLPYVQAIAALNPRELVGPSRYAHSAATAWLRWPFAPFEVDEREWRAMENLIGTMLMPAPFG